MKALILNSGLGHRMGVLTSEHPKCMTEISSTDTILSRQLRLIASIGIKEVVMTTGYFDDILVNYCKSLNLPLHYNFVKNPIYDQTNYIYSIYCAKELLQNDDIILMHGDLVFETSVLEDIITCDKSCMKVSSTIELPAKDFKAVVHNGQVKKVGVEFFDNAMEAQALYKLNCKDWQIWLDKICEYCENNNRKCYAEVALNDISDKCIIYAFDVKERLCSEIDTPEDLAVVRSRLYEIENRIVYTCFTSDIIHEGHIAAIKKSQRMGKLIVGILSDDIIGVEKPIMPFMTRKIILENIIGVSKVIEQKSLSYSDILKKLQPDYLIHEDSWRLGECRKDRDEAVNILAEYGGKLVEYTYAAESSYKKL